MIRLQIMVVYDNDGNIVFSQVSDNFNANYNCLLTDFKPNRVMKKVDVDNKTIIWGDSEEMEQAKRELEKHREEELMLIKKLLILEAKAN